MLSGVAASRSKAATQSKHPYDPVSSGRYVPVRSEIPSRRPTPEVRPPVPSYFFIRGSSLALT